MHKFRYQIALWSSSNLQKLDWYQSNTSPIKNQSQGIVMKKSKIVLVISISIATLSTSVYAQSSGTKSGAFGGGWSVGLEAGVIDVSKLASSIAVRNGTQMVNTFGGYASETYTNYITSGRIYLGKSFTENIGGEVGYMATTPMTINYAGRTAGNVAWAAQQSFSLGSGDVFATLRGDKDSLLENIYLKVGAHYSGISASTTATANGTSASSTYSYSGVGPAIGIMYDKGISQSFDVRVSYVYYGNIAGVSGLNASLYNVGAVYKF